MFKNIMQKLFLSCLRATELIEKKFCFKLSLKEKLQLKGHKMMCNACSNYEKQSGIIDDGIARSLNKHHITPEEVKQLKDKINQHLSQN
jgi:hypothetical protein